MTYVTESVEAASWVEPKVHLAEIPVVTVSGLREQKSESLVPSNTLIMPLGLSVGAPNTKKDNIRQCMILNRQVNLPNSV